MLAGFCIARACSTSKARSPFLSGTAAVLGIFLLRPLLHRNYCNLAIECLFVQQGVGFGTCRPTSLSDLLLLFDDVSRATLVGSRCFVVGCESVARCVFEFFTRQLWDTPPMNRDDTPPTSVV